jgi:uncharacterized protein (DUF952 family)
MAVVAALFHLTNRECWEAALRSGSYETSTVGVSLQEEGFIHCSLGHQVRGVADRYLADATELTLLVIDETKVGAPIRYESGGPGSEAFPHIYGPLPVDAVSDVRFLIRDGDGEFDLPT